MSQHIKHIELNIISAEEVRRYAHGNTSSIEEQDFVEQALLNDDRVRWLVIEEAAETAVDNVKETPPSCFSKSILSCEISIAIYESLLRRAAPPTVLDFASSRLKQRLALNKELTQILPVNYGACHTALPNLNEKTFGCVLAAITEYETELLNNLKEAFAAPSWPMMKAKLACWISGLEVDIFQIMWLPGACNSVKQR